MYQFTAIWTIVVTIYNNDLELKFQDIINSPSIDADCRKINNLAGKNRLDSTFFLMIIKSLVRCKGDKT